MRISNKIALNSVKKTIYLYFKTTTLHGFKYLCPTYYADGFGWLLCCCASACCAGMLCAILWGRFLDMPALLTLWDKVSEEPITDKIPSVYICPSVESVAESFLDKLAFNKSGIHRMAIILTQLFNGKSAAKDQLELLESFLLEKNVTLPEAMMEYSPSCTNLIRKCRYYELMISCDELFEKQLTMKGVCCVMEAKKLLNFQQSVLAKSYVTQMLDFVLHCSHGSILHGCKFFTSYEHEENISEDFLLPGYYYRSQLRFASIPERRLEEYIVGSPCVSDEDYSRPYCIMKCAEAWCGCSDPFHILGDSSLPICPLTRLECLRVTSHKNNTGCECLKPCKKIDTYEMWESSELIINKHTVIDPLYSRLNVTSIVINFRVNIDHSRILLLTPTETWLSLLSSLGGVFNMFLGVGLFSVFEFLFFVFVKLPKAIRKTSEIYPSNAPDLCIGRY